MKELSEKYCDGETIRLIGRGSRLSLLQLEIVSQKIKQTCPGINVQIIVRNSRGDDLQNVPLHTVEGSDFFTEDIFDSLSAGEADIAVHSLKDMSSEHFFGSNKFAVVDRDDTRDIAIFHPGVINKIQRGETLIIGTCSPRREEMAMVFLQKALPQLNKHFTITTKDIRGNVDTRLRKLEAGEYDGIILATAGLNRLLRSPEDAPSIKEVLKNKRLMLLPLVECVPAPCQGAIVAEVTPANEKATAILEIINDPALMDACIKEKTTARQYGVGCLQKFGVTTVSYGSQQVLYAAGKDNEGTTFTKWTGLPELPADVKNLFSTAEHMGSFFQYGYNSEQLDIQEPIVYAANYKAIQTKELEEQLRTRKVWASGTKTWFELAKRGIWVEGSADAFGLEFLEKAWQMPLLEISKDEVAVITHTDASEIWKAKGWKAYGTYSTTEKSSAETEQKIKEADIIFWTSYRQFVQYKSVLKDRVVHICSYGETAQQFKAAGITPIVFPNIKSFQQWRQTFTRSLSVA